MFEDGRFKPGWTNTYNSDLSSKIQSQSSDSASNSQSPDLQRWHRCAGNDNDCVRVSDTLSTKLWYAKQTLSLHLVFQCCGDRSKTIENKREIITDHLRGGGGEHQCVLTWQCFVVVHKVWGKLRCHHAPPHLPNVGNVRIHGHLMFRHMHESIEFCKVNDVLRLTEQRNVLAGRTMEEVSGKSLGFRMSQPFNAELTAAACARESHSGQVEITAPG